MTYGIKTQIREGSLDEIGDWLTHRFEHDFHLEYDPDEPNFGVPVATVLFEGDEQREAFLSFVFNEHDNRPGFPIIAFRRFEWDGEDRREDERREEGDRRGNGADGEPSDRRSRGNRRRVADRRNNLACL